MPRWLKGSFLALVVFTFLKLTSAFGSSGTIKSAPAAGWLVLVPPFALSDPPGPLLLKAPLSRWTEMDSTVTAADCEEQRNNMTRMSQRADITSPYIQFELLLYHYAVCVSSADPRFRLGRNGHRIVHRFMGFPKHERASTGYAGPPVEQSSAAAPESPEAPLESLGMFEDPRTPILLMLFGIVLMATVGPLGGWIRDKIGTPPTLGSQHSAHLKGG